MSGPLPQITGWSDPPSESVPSDPRRSLYEQIATELRASPGRWAQLNDRRTAVAAGIFASNVRRGVTAAFRPEGHWEARAWERSVWVRYVGDLSGDS